ncbi:MAG: peroxiredoxin [Desulfobacterales bacterium]|nr:peroxiredoxin [Desulfobacterales bacterium]
MVENGKKTPIFTLPDQNNNNVALKDFNGKWIVLYFYPKDNTPGCTNEAIDFTSLTKQFNKLNAVIIGVSPDSSESHRKFIEKYELKILLLSDIKKAVLKKYGAWGIKKNYGKEYEGVIRSTFLISPSGNIAEKWTNVRVRIKRKSDEVRHADIVFDRLKALSS